MDTLSSSLDDGGGDRMLRPCVSIVIHAVAPAHLAACERLIAALERFGALPLTLLAVPRFHGDDRDPRFEEWLAARHARGDEIALQGFTHSDDGEPVDWLDHLIRRRYSHGEAEFSALREEQALRRLRGGIAWLQQLGLAPQGFVAPAWLLSQGSWSALRQCPFSYTCTLRRLVLLPELRMLQAQALVWSDRTAWQRNAARLVNPLLARLQSSAPLLRFDLHPEDADDPLILRSWQQLLAHMLDDRPATTLGRVADWLRQEGAPLSAPGALQA